MWNLKYVVGNPAMFTKVTSCSDNPMERRKALEAGEMLSGHGWRVWVESVNEPTRRIFESEVEKTHRSAAVTN